MRVEALVVQGSATGCTITVAAAGRATVLRSWPDHDVVGTLPTGAHIATKRGPAPSLRRHRASQSERHQEPIARHPAALSIDSTLGARVG
jgi:hypothetical protein